METLISLSFSIQTTPLELTLSARRSPGFGIVNSILEDGLERPSRVSAFDTLLL